MTRDFRQLEFGASENYLATSQSVYDELAREVAESKHGSRFSIREFTLEPTNGVPSPFNIDLPYLEPIASTDEDRLKVANLASSLLMPHGDWIALIEGFKTVYSNEVVAAHLASGGVLKFIDSHRTYTGQVAQEIGSWCALKDIGVTDPHEIQTTIISRVTSLFRLPLIVALFENKDYLIEHHGGGIIEDVLLRYAGGLLTLPNSPSGNRLIKALQGGISTRREIVDKTKLAYEHLVNRGGSDGQIFFEGSSGSENFVKSIRGTRRRIIGEVKHRTTELTTDYNQIDEAERVMTIGTFMESDPFTGNPDSPIAPSPTPFAFLEPCFPKNQRDFDLMMDSMAVVGTQIKSSGQLPYKYDKTIIGRNVEPEVIFVHTV